MKLVNVLGQSVFSIKNISSINFSELKINNVSSGAYLIKLQTETQLISKKVLVD